MAAIISITGMGATVFNFCCNDCADKLFSAISFCERHDKHSHTCCETMDVCCGQDNVVDDENCCNAERHSITLDSFHAKPETPVPFIWVNPGSLLFVSLCNIEDANQGYLYPVDDPPKIPDTKNYLSFIQVYLI